MSSFSDHIIELFQEEELRFFFVEKADKGQLHIIDRNGKRNRVPETRVVFVFPNRTASDTATTIIDQLQEEISSLMKDIDTQLLWESVPEYDREYTINELGNLYFNNPSVVEQSALFRALREDSLHFKRKGIYFYPRREQQIEEMTLQAEKDKEKKEKSDKLLAFFKSVFASKTIVQPDAFFMNQLQEMKNRLYQHRHELAEHVLHTTNPRRTVASLVYELLKRTGMIEETEDRFLVEAGISTLFTQEVEAAAETLTAITPGINRLDLTNLDTFSIDDASTREIDDALSIEPIQNGYRIGIHISDVSSRIEPGSILDKEALKRISSIYLETGVITMFPEVLSCDRMSLQQDKVRSVLTLLVDCTEGCDVLDYQFVMSDICVKHRLTYDSVDEILTHPRLTPEPLSCSKRGEIELASKLNTLKYLTDTWKQQRLDAGAIEIVKPEFNLEVKGEEIKLTVYDRLSPSRTIVSECMILFNRLAAQFALERDIPMIYRAQDAPSGTDRGTDRGTERGTDFRPSSPSEQYNPLLTDQIMKQMRPGRLTTIPLPHAGLGVDIYTQLSSPIRRYADLVLQRQLTSALSNRECPYKTEELFEVLASIEENEKQIKEVYQRSKLYWLIRYLEKYRMNDIFPAMIINMSPRQAFVELLEFGYRVALPSSPSYKIGQALALKIRKLDAEEGQMLFEQAQTN